MQETVTIIVEWKDTRKRSCRMLHRQDLGRKEAQENTSQTHDRSCNTHMNTIERYSCASTITARRSTV